MFVKKEKDKTEPAILLCGLIYHEDADLEGAINALEKKFGRVGFESETVPFTHTKYYANEMGENLMRRFVAFEDPVTPDSLPEVKIFTNTLEHEYLNPNKGRTVNIDPGLVTMGNICLASTKNFAHRLYLGHGVYGEVTLLYEDRKFYPLPWTYPDYRTEKTFEFLQRVRDYLKETAGTRRRDEK